MYFGIVGVYENYGIWEGFVKFGDMLGYGVGVLVFENMVGRYL